MIPRLHFAHLPTAIEPMPRLTEALGGPRLLVKRDDQTGLAFGGNKTRKLEFLVAEAQAQHAQTLITAGAVQSNHCRQTAAAAARFGMECILVLAGDPPAEASANLLLDQLFNARIIWAGPREQRDRVLAETFDRTQADGKQPYLVPYGGSSPTGALGYAFAVEELMKQNPCEGSDPSGFALRTSPSQGCPDWIVFASSSGGTQAGLVLGSRVFGYRGNVLGISIDEPQHLLQEHVAALASDTSERLGPRIQFAPDEVQVNAEYCAAGYGVLTGAEREAVGMFARTEGLLLDPVYTGRAAAGLIDLIRKGFFKKSEAVLFWHTGGQPALFADKYQPEIVNKE
jgi:D-cysteine desulfhydrase